MENNVVVFLYTSTLFIFENFLWLFLIAVFDQNLKINLT